MSSLGALDQATAVAERAAELAGEDWDVLAGPDAVAGVEAITAARSFLDAALLRGIARVEATDAVRGLGWATVKDFLTHLTGGHKGSGGGLVRAVEQLRDLPEVQTALEAGRVTLPQARAIASKVHTLPRVPQFRTAVAEAMLDLVDTHGHDASGLQTAFSDVVRDLDPDSAIVDAEKERVKAERAAHHARHLSFAEDGHGGVRLKGYGTVEDAERIKATLHPLAAPVTTEPGACGGVSRRPGEAMFDENGVATSAPCLTPECGHDGRDPRQAGARLWDALVDACDRLAATDELPRDHGSKPRVVVLIDQDSLKQQVIDAGLARTGHTPTGARFSASAVRRLACDAEIIPSVLGAEGQVLDVGRAQRLVTAAIWMALVVRDRHCAFPGCTRMPLACDAHHVVHWADGGATSLDNLVMLCRHHHVLVHQTPWAVHIDPDTRQPVWTPPPRHTLDSLRGRATYRPARPRAA
ncbi:HNH endonuclease signature motif containing protein [Nocardioides daeguensis]|uniref:HNH endonuclease signature motif containing protein n=2 Tax=Nocardioides daeguensis TaxID=908359 RepID=UPI001C45686F|nr:HNH endonuclease signature motif containing protein [Nocardioides daeguensis]MBV6726566.1 HNH endonuclease [Nocardioides daeguensis]MCR1772409.1 HNH endonuclease [Nocardioides daeguensis]